MREIEIAGEKLVIHEFDSVTGRALTGSWLWDSALLLSHWMVAQGQVEYNFVRKIVLELGAGLTGLPGLTAARLGASRVILTDVEPLLPGLKKNVEANGLVSSICFQNMSQTKFLFAMFWRENPHKNPDSYFPSAHQFRKHSGERTEKSKENGMKQ